MLPGTRPKSRNSGRLQNFEAERTHPIHPMFHKTFCIAVLLATLTTSLSAQAPSARPVQAGTPTATGDIALERGWDSTITGENPSVFELKIILEHFAKAQIPGPQESKGVELYAGVTYLMSRLEATRILRLPSSVMSKHRLAFPGFPAHSFYIYDHDGLWEGVYNKLLLVTDKTDQVVAVQLLAENPKTGRSVHNFLNKDWHVYDFINFGTKALTTMSIRHEPIMSKPDVLRIDSILVENRVAPPLARGIRSRVVVPGPVLSSRAVKLIRLYLPKPVMELCLYTMSHSK